MGNFNAAHCAASGNPRRGDEDGKPSSGSSSQSDERSMHGMFAAKRQTPTGSIASCPLLRFIFLSFSCPVGHDAGYSPRPRRLLKKAGENFFCIIFYELTFSTRWAAGAACRVFLPGGRQPAAVLRPAKHAAPAEVNPFGKREESGTRRLPFPGDVWPQAKLNGGSCASSCAWQETAATHRLTPAGGIEPAHLIRTRRTAAQTPANSSKINRPYTPPGRRTAAGRACPPAGCPAPNAAPRRPCKQSNSRAKAPSAG